MLTSSYNCVTPVVSTSTKTTITSNGKPLKEMSMESTSSLLIHSHFISLFRSVSTSILTEDKENNPGKVQLL